MFVKNLDENLTYIEFIEFFRKFGEIDSAKLSVDNNGLNYGYGYVQFSNPNDAKTVENLLEKDKILKEKTLYIQPYEKIEKNDN